MAVNMKREIKKACYYVWFLGARESRGLRGEQYALPAIQYLERKSRELEPFKVTLQVSHKGLKIVQNVSPKGKQQTIKHFIPHSSITCAVQRGDTVACVLLLFNPVTRCPIHVHVYRCDSIQTAEVLTAHLESLIQRPENQKKFADIERKLQNRGAIPISKKASGSEASDLSNGSSQEDRCLATLYDSLAAELKQKLSTGKSPILLPPRDYDTVHRQKGNLSNIDTRRCLNQTIVGVNGPRGKNLESSNDSSGIGSESPVHSECPRNTNDTHSTSEDEWGESTAYLLHEAYDLSPPRVRARSPPTARNDRYSNEQKSFRRRQPEQSDDERMNEFTSIKYEANVEPLSSMEKEYPKNFARRYDKFRESSRELDLDRRFGIAVERRQPSQYSPKQDQAKLPLQRFGSESSLRTNDVSPRDRFQVAKQKFMNMERARFNRELEEHMRARRYMLEKREQEEKAAKRAVSPRRASPPRRSFSPQRNERRQYDDMQPKRHDERRMMDDPFIEQGERHRRRFDDGFIPQRKMDEKRMNENHNRALSPRRYDESRLQPRRFDYMKENLLDRRPELPRLTSKSLKRYESPEERYYRDEDDDIEPVVVRRAAAGGGAAVGGWRASGMRHSYAEPVIRHSYAEANPRLGLSAKPY